MSGPHYVSIAGRRLTLRQASKESGIEYATVADRYRKGDRDERVVRPLDKGGRRRAGENTDLAQMNEYRDAKREIQRRAHERKRARLERQQAVLRAIREAHAALLSAPLIAPGLLSDEERVAVRRSIVGRQRWWAVDSAYKMRR